MIELTRDEAETWLMRETVVNLAVLGALLFEPVEVIYGLEHDEQLAAICVVVAGEANLPDSLPTVLLAGQDADALAVLACGPHYPSHATWVASTPECRAVLERQFRCMHTADQGMVYFGAETRLGRNNDWARQLTGADTAVDLSPCSLGVMALSYWMVRGWRVFGVIENERLLGHAVAAYPIANTEEISAVFTAPEARRRGVASACAAAAITDIQARGKLAVYVSRKDNTASIRVAEGLEMHRLFETWEFVT